MSIDGAEVVLLDGAGVIEALVRGRILSPPHVAAAAATLASLGGGAPSPLREADLAVVGHVLGWIWAVTLRDPVQAPSLVLVHADGTPLPTSAAEKIVEQGEWPDRAALAPVADRIEAHARTMEAAERRYLEHLAIECGVLQLDGLPADGEARARELRLERLFVPLRLQRWESDRETGSAALKVPHHGTMRWSVDSMLSRGTWDHLIRTLRMASPRAPLTDADAVTAVPKVVSARFVEAVGKVVAITTQGARLVGALEMDVGATLRRVRHIAILAPPGGGKSTLIKWIASSFAGAAKGGRFPNGPEGITLPVLVRCRELGPRCREPFRRILSRVPEMAALEEVRSGFDDLIDAGLRAGTLLVLLDGLDEIADDGDRRVLVEHVRTFLSTYPTVYLIVTSREPGYREVAGILGGRCETYLLSPFNDDDVRRFVVAWHRELAGPHRDARAHAGELADAICDNDRIRALAGNPLLLTTLLLVERWLGQLPTKRSILYQKAVEVLLHTWNVQAHAPMDLDEVVPQLSFIAFWMMSERRQQITERQLKRLLREAREQMPDVLSYAQTSVADFVRRVELRSSLLVQAGHAEEDGSLVPMYEFRHLTFQEYLAAVALVEQHLPESVSRDTLASIVAPHLEDDWWKEVILLAAVLAGRREAPNVVGEMIQRLRSCREEDPRQLALGDTLARTLADEVRVSPNVVGEAISALALVGLSTGFAVQPLHALAMGRHGGSLLRAAARHLSEQAPRRSEQFTRLGELAVEILSRSEVSILAAEREVSPERETEIDAVVAELGWLQSRWMDRPAEAYGYRGGAGPGDAVDLMARCARSKAEVIRWAAQQMWAGLVRSGLRPEDAGFLLESTARAWMEGSEAGLAPHESREMLSVLASRGEYGSAADLAKAVPGLREFLEARARSDDPDDALAALLVGHLSGGPWSREALIEQLSRLAGEAMAREGDVSWTTLCLIDAVLVRLGARSVLPRRLPALCTRAAVMPPGCVAPLDVGRPRSLALVKALDEMRSPWIVVVSQRDEAVEVPARSDCFEMGAVAHVLKAIEHSAGNYSVILSSLMRVRIVNWVREEPFVEVEVEPVFRTTSHPLGSSAAVERCLTIIERLIQRTPDLPREAAGALGRRTFVPGLLADLLVAHLPLKAAAQPFLEMSDELDRLLQASAVAEATIAEAERSTL